jgi:hypothetical protein
MTNRITDIQMHQRYLNFRKQYLSVIKYIEMSIFYLTLNFQIFIFEKINSS